MRTLFNVSLFGLLAGALLHCAADAKVAHDDLDGGDSPSDAAVLPVEEDADAPDSPDADAAVEDAGPCSADHWCPTSLPSEDLNLTAVWSFAANDALAASRTKMLQWDGTKWSALDAPEAEGLTSLWATSPNDIWGVAEWSQRIVHGTRTAAGRPFTWTKVQYDWSSPTMEIIRGVGTNELWVSGNRFGNSVIQRGVITTENDPDGGTVANVTWTTIPIDIPVATMAFWITEGNKLWVAGNGPSFDGVVALGQPSDAAPNVYTWNEVLKTSQSYGGLPAIWGASSGEVWGIGKNGLNFRGALADGGVEWVDVPSNANTLMRGIWGRGANDVWLVGEYGAVRHWDGAKWNVSRLAVGDVPMWRHLDAVHGGPAGDVWAVGRGVALHRSAGGSP